jgi:hypothetical protein
MIFEIWFIVICLMIVAGIAFRLLPRSLASVHLHKVAPKAAAVLVSEFIVSSYDGEFGYPSGMFEIERSGDNEIVAREIVAKGSHFTQVLAGLYRAVLGIGAGFGCIGAVVGLVIAAFLTPALLYAALAETLLKYLLRSRIVCRLQRSGDGTDVAFTLRGPVALLVGRRLERAFHQPVLPPRIATLAGVTAGQPVPVSSPAPASSPERAA